MAFGDDKRKFDPGIVSLIIGILVISPIGSMAQFSIAALAKSATLMKTYSYVPRRSF